MKINFTKQHYQDLVNLVAQAAMNHVVINTKMGQPLDIVALLHTTSINTLNDIKASLVKKIRGIEDRDEWVDADTVVLDTLKGQKELVNLIVGWKRWKMEIEENRKKKENLTKKLAELKESTKTPEDRIKELEAELATMDAEEDFK
jgi:predicted nuclease with TOPRIM domain